MQVTVPIKRTRRASSTLRNLPVRRVLSNPEPVDASSVEVQSPLYKPASPAPVLNNFDSTGKAIAQSFVNTSQNIVLPIKPSKFALQSMRHADKLMKKSLDSTCERERSGSTINYNSTPGEIARPQTPSLNIKKTSIRKNSQNSMLNLKRTNVSTEESTNMCSIEKSKERLEENVATTPASKTKGDVGDFFFDSVKNNILKNTVREKKAPLKSDNSSMIDIKEYKPTVIPVKRTTLRHKSANRK